MTTRRLRAGAAKARGSNKREERGTRETTVSATDRDGPYHEEADCEDVFSAVFEKDEHVTRLSVGAGLTINLGDFQSLRIDCRVELPCHTTKDSIETAFETASSFVAEKVTLEQERWLGGSSKGSK